MLTLISPPPPHHRDEASLQTRRLRHRGVESFPKVTEGAWWSCNTNPDLPGPKCLLTHPSLLMSFQIPVGWGGRIMEAERKAGFLGLSRLCPGEPPAHPAHHRMLSRRTDCREGHRLHGRAQPGSLTHRAGVGLLFTRTPPLQAAQPSALFRSSLLTTVLPSPAPEVPPPCPTAPTLQNH